MIGSHWSQRILTVSRITNLTILEWRNRKVMGKRPRNWFQTVIRTNNCQFVRHQCWIHLTFISDALQLILCCGLPEYYRNSLMGGISCPIAWIATLHSFNAEIILVHLSSYIVNTLQWIHPSYRRHNGTSPHVECERKKWYRHMLRWTHSGHSWAIIRHSSQYTLQTEMGEQ